MIRQFQPSPFPLPSDFPRTWFAALVTKTIAWDNCEGGVAVMARPGQVIAVTYNGRERGRPSYTAHFDYGGYTVSDYISVADSIQLVSHAEGRRLHAEYTRKLNARLDAMRDRAELMVEEWINEDGQDAHDGYLDD